MRQLVADTSRAASLGILGEPRVNVLALNLALDAPARDRAKAAAMPAAS